MNKEYIKLNDDTFIVSDEQGHITTQKKVSEKLLNIENQIQVLSNTIDETDDFIKSDKKDLSFCKKIFVAQPFLLAAVTATLCIGVSSPNILVNALISGIVISPFSICLGTKIKSLKKEIKELHIKRDTTNNLYDEYNRAWCEEKSNIYFKAKDEKSVEKEFDIKVEKVQNEELINDINEQLEKPKTLIKKRR